MIFGVYSVKDVLVGFNNPFIMVNDDVAKRAFINNTKGKPEANDMELYRLGLFDDQTGKFQQEEPIALAFGKEDL